MARRCACAATAGQAELCATMPSSCQGRAGGKAGHRGEGASARILRQLYSTEAPGSEAAVAPHGRPANFYELARRVVRVQQPHPYNEAARAMEAVRAVHSMHVQSHGHVQRLPSVVR
eukprot:CAMPEP_0195111882 /NCGR_PEP_ID=MMETSP0448-20130528/97491_1 /TAXON_ID=66468 /ORGANISM="Heterocapsa triquestra, Strain CCMP 448" /LENGTH=116 /DNA_ID=CAMNT_0040148697 /DNA_START=188 /DNA_END=535 /DNA_ORIENTATION=+